MVQLAYRGQTVVLGVREGFVTEEFLTLARAENPNAARLARLKREMADGVMARDAREVYERLT